MRKTTDILFVQKIQWQCPGFQKLPGGGVAPANFITIGFAPIGEIYYQYSVTAGAATIITTFLAAATGDLDGSDPGSQGLFTLNQSGIFIDANKGVW